MKTRAHQTLKAHLWRCAFIALSLFGLNPTLQAKESSGMQWTVTRHTWGEDLSGSLQGAGGIGGLLRSTSVAATQDGKRNEEHEHSPAEHTFSYDSNGNVILLTDSQGRESARYAYDAFGKTLTSMGPASQRNRYRFSTKPVEVESGLVYYGYRYYDPVTGRWPSRDPLKEMGGVNLYGMVGNDSINERDFKGLAICSALVAAVLELLDTFNVLDCGGAGQNLPACYLCCERAAMVKAALHGIALICEIGEIFVSPGTGAIGAGVSLLAMYNTIQGEADCKSGCHQCLP